MPQTLHAPSQKMEGRRALHLLSPRAYLPASPLIMAGVPRVLHSLAGSDRRLDGAGTTGYAEVVRAEWRMVCIPLHVTAPADGLR